jgi:hypothetical protein
MARETAWYALKGFVLSQMVLSMPKTAGTRDSWRDANIQVEKLNRMVKKFTKRFPDPNVQRKKVADLRRLSQQSKRVDDSIAVLVEEHNLRNVMPNPDFALKKKVRSASHQYVQGLNHMVSEARKQVLLADNPATRDNAGFGSIRRLPKKH